ncbi:MAG: HNH endonuclease signature motif containing protein [Methylococcales bacterium]
MDTETAEFIDVEQVSKYFYYDPTSDSSLRWLVSNGAALKDSTAGSSVSGYYKVKLDYRIYQVHRIIWSLFYGNPDPLLVINHIDCNPLNNIISNLETCTRKENSNRSKARLGIQLRTNNTSGINGIHESNNGTGNLYAKVAWYHNGRALSKNFSYSKLGKDGAWEAAVLFKHNLDNVIL